MERDHRPVSHRRTRRIGSRIGFLVCFNWGTSSSSSSSSMKISRSILSPGRRDSNMSLSSSLSRRLRSNGSLKGGAGACGQASPMFPVTGSNKKKGLGFEIDEPSSPKVTCIGLVRVKTKTKHGNNKKKQKMRTRSKRRSGGGEASFRKIEQNQEGMNHHHQPECLPHRNHRWIHLPFTICEGLKALGAELNCFVLCSGRSSSSSSSFSSCNWGSEREKRREKKRRRCGSRVMSSSSCGAVFMRWLFALEDNNEHRKEDRDFHVVAADNETGIHEVSEQKGREFIEAMADEEVEEEEEERRVADEEVEEEEEEEGRITICVPPRNALLLMRCRSEPFRTSSLATRFWDDFSSSSSCNNLKADESNEEHYEEKLQQVVVAEEEDKPLKKELPGEENKEEEIGVISRRVSVSAREEQENLIKEDDDDDEQHQVDQDEEEKEVKKEENPENAGTEEEAVIVAEAHELRNSEKEVLEEEEEEEGFNVPAIAENSKLQEDKTSKCENEEQRRLSFSSSTIPILLPQPVAHDLVPEPATLPLFGLKIEEKVANLEEERAQMWNNEEKLETQKQEEEEEEEEIQEPSFEPEQEEQSNSQTLKEEEEEEEEEGRRSEDGNRAASDQVLPECLLLMMCEPKVSMEVSKETWVCSNDFIRHHRNNLHHHHHQQLPPEKQQREVIVKKIRGADEPKKKTYANHQLRQLKQKKPRDHKIMSAAAAAAPQPPRSSCSKVEPLVVAIEKKLVSGSKAPEPFVLTRCKSEPMRSSDKLAPEACFWKNMKLEPHRQTTLSVGATEVGF